MSHFFSLDRVGDFFRKQASIVPFSNHCSSLMLLQETGYDSGHPVHAWKVVLLIESCRKAWAVQLLTECCSGLIMTMRAILTMQMTTCFGLVFLSSSVHGCVSNWHKATRHSRYHTGNSCLNRVLCSKTMFCSGINLILVLALSCSVPLCTVTGVSQYASLLSCAFVRYWPISLCIDSFLFSGVMFVAGFDGIECGQY